MKFLEEDNWPEKRNITPEMMPYFKKSTELSLEDNILMWNLRVVVPRSLEAKVLRELHNQHLGIVRMKSLSRIHVWFPGID